MNSTHSTSQFCVYILVRNTFIYLYHLLGGHPQGVKNSELYPVLGNLQEFPINKPRVLSAANDLVILSWGGEGRGEKGHCQLQGKTTHKEGRSVTQLLMETVSSINSTMVNVIENIFQHSRLARTIKDTATICGEKPLLKFLMQCSFPKPHKWKGHPQVWMDLVVSVIIRLE